MSSLSESFIQEVLNAAHEALETVNSPTEVVWPIEQNLDIARALLAAEGVPVELWTNARIWESAILRARSQGKLVQRPTTEELNRQRERNDRAAGNQTKLSNNNESPKNALQELFKNLDATLTRKPRDQKQPTTEAIVWPTVEVDYGPEMSEEDRAAFKALSAENTRIWLRRRAVRKHEQLYGWKAARQA